jgi:hypothetical protein
MTAISASEFSDQTGTERIWLKLDLDLSNKHVGMITSLPQELNGLFISPSGYERTTKDIVAAYLTTYEHAFWQRRVQSVDAATMGAPSAIKGLERFFK